MYSLFTVHDVLRVQPDISSQIADEKRLKVDTPVDISYLQFLH